MRNSTYAYTLVAAIAGGLCSPAVFGAQPWYDLQIVIPSAANGQATVQLTGGWPLVIRAMAPKAAPTYAYVGDAFGSLAIVASDTSGCFDKLVLDPDAECLALPPKEVYTRLWIDSDAPGRQDGIGDSDIFDLGGILGAIVGAVILLYVATLVLRAVRKKA